MAAPPISVPTPGRPMPKNSATTATRLTPTHNVWRDSPTTTMVMSPVPTLETSQTTPMALNLKG